jgi:hypothetical protein
LDRLKLEEVQLEVVGQLGAVLDQDLVCTVHPISGLGPGITDGNLILLAYHWVNWLYPLILQECPDPTDLWLQLPVV